MLLSMNFPSDDLPVPPMTPERARHIADIYKAHAPGMMALEPGEGAKLERRTEQWLAYAAELEAKPHG